MEKSFRELKFFRNTTVQDAPGGAENTRGNTDKCLLCLMQGMFRRRAGTHGTLSRKMSVATWRRVFLSVAERLVNWNRHNRGLAEHRTRMCFRVGVDPGCQCFVRGVFLGMLCAPTACQSCKFSIVIARKWL